MLGRWSEIAKMVGGGSQRVQIIVFELYAECISWILLKLTHRARRSHGRNSSSPAHYDRVRID